MIFKRKVYDQLLNWKKDFDGKYACLLEGARRVGKTTIAEEFAKNEYESYIKVDFSNISSDMLDIFKDIANLDLFFLRMQLETGITLVDRKSLIIFDEVQLYPKVRQAIKHLVADGRYDYIETGSLISIKKNVKDILIPSEEHKIQVYPMDYEEFSLAIGNNPNMLDAVYKTNRPIGDSTNRKLMRDFRLYMVIGGMPQVVETYLNTKDLKQVDRVKREIISLYYDDLKKIDSSGRLSNIYKSVPSQLALNKKRFVISSALGKRKSYKDDERIFDLIDSKIVIPCYNVTQPSATMSQTKCIGNFKLYLSDTGLFTTILFDNGNGRVEDIYHKLLSDKLDADLGYLYENVVAQILVANNRELFFHTWNKENSTHYYEVDFLIASRNKVIPFEVKSSIVKRHASIDNFAVKYSNIVGERYLISQKDVSSEKMLKNKPFYLLPFLLKNL